MTDACNKRVRLSALHRSVRSSCFLAVICGMMNRLSRPGAARLRLTRSRSWCCCHLAALLLRAVWPLSCLTAGPALHVALDLLIGGGQVYDHSAGWALITAAAVHASAANRHQLCGGNGELRFAPDNTHVREPGAYQRGGPVLGGRCLHQHPAICTIVMSRLSVVSCRDMQAARMLTMLRQLTRNNHMQMSGCWCKW